MPAQRLPEYRVKAKNTSANGENAIHDDAVAQRYGFAGALVPGVTVYAYLTQPLAAAYRAAWLVRGTATVRFVRPVFEGEEVTIAAAVTGQGRGGQTVALTAATASTPECAVMTAGLPAGAPTPVNLALYPAAPLPAERPRVSRELLLDVDALGTPETVYDEARAAGIRHLGGARVGETLATRGRVRSVYERKGREYVELDVVVVAGAPARPVAHVLHTAIYRLPPPDA
ncbi:MAG: hypothetical protein ACREJG_04915 [Candidatus Rokuibacteriota bacterium]